MKKIITLTILSIVGIALFAQAPKGFSYQAVLRDAEGKILANQNVTLRFSLINNDETITYYTEEHSLTTSELGLVNATVGTGANTSGTIDTIPWGKIQIKLKVEIKNPGASVFSSMGTQALLAVPYALFASNTNEILSNQTATDEDPIFVVRNKDGKIVFAVYQTGVRIYVEDTSSAIKSAKGGFAIGGLSTQTKSEVEYLRITADSARIYIDENTTKGTKGGFAIGGLSTQTKGNYDLFRVTSDSTRVYVNTSQAKGAKGGFAIGGLSTQTKALTSQFLNLTPNNYFIGQNSGELITTGKFNSVFGYTAGSSLDIGSRNTFMGNQSGEKTTSGNSNVYIGNMAGNANINGSQNIFIGDSAGLSCGSSGCIIIGNSAGKKATSLYKAVFIGNEAGANDVSASPNTFIGNQAGYSNTSGYQNLFLGNLSGYNNTSGFSNLFLGNWAGYSNTTGGQNLFIGEMAGYNNTTTGGNTFIGYFSAYNNTDGHGNTFIGNYSGYQNTTGSNNTFMGNGVGSLNTSGEDNVFIGQNAGLSNTTGSYNTYIGKQAGLALENGNNNTIVGHFAGYYKKTGNSNVFIGAGAGSSNLNGSGNVFIGIGAGGDDQGSNKLYITNTNTDSTQVLIYGRFDSKVLCFNANVGIGTTQPDKKLHVAGDARIEGSLYYGIGTDAYSKPDFVFQSNYRNYFDPLKVEEFIKTQGHLPWITKAIDEKAGINLTRMQFETVETVENLQLQIIQIKKDYQSQIDKQNEEITKLKEEIDAIKKFIKK